MLNTFPYLLSFGLVAPFLLRVVLGFLFINLGRAKFGPEKERWYKSLDPLSFKSKDFWLNLIGSIEILGGILLIIGLYTQITALIFSILTLAELYIEYREPEVLARNIVFYLLVFVISLYLLFSGAGFWAFDLPL